MKIILRPEQYQQMMLELKAELQGNKFEQVETQENSQESESRIEKGDALKEQATEQAQATEQTQATEQAQATEQTQATEQAQATSSYDPGVITRANTWIHRCLVKAQMVNLAI